MPKLSAQNQQQRATQETIKIISLLQHSRTYYSDSVVSKIEKSSDLTVNFDHKSDLKTVPLPATFIHDLSSILMKSDNINANFYSNYPFPNHSQRVLDKFQKDSIEFLTKNPDKIFSKNDVVDGKNIFRIAVADIFTSKNCINCHNTRVDSPKKDWKIGDVRGVFEVNLPITDDFILSNSEFWYVSIFIIFIVLVSATHYTILHLKREQELLNAALMLENKIQRRTKDLQESNQLLLEYKKAVDASAIVSKSDLYGNIIYVNDAFCKISGYSREELMGKPHNLVRSPDVDKSFYSNLWKTIKSKNIFKGIVKNRAKDGNAYYVAANIIPILDEKGEILEYLSLRYEITELIEAKNRALNAESAKSIFLANMSHEIRTPLNAIIGFSTILCESNLSKTDKEYANVISRSAKSLLSIINDVLDISKIESGKLNISEKSTFFIEFSENIVELFSIVAKEKNIRFIYKASASIPKALIFDATRLQQVISNLLSNAIKFTPTNGRIIFEISLIDIKDAKAKIKFSIKDSGIGMSIEQQKKIFEPFSQADDGISRKYGGTGLGLAICSDIIKLMNSNIDLTSELGDGSEFSFILDIKIDNSLKLVEQMDNKLIFGICKNDNDKEYLAESVKNTLLEIGLVKELDELKQVPYMLFCFDQESISKIKEDRGSVKTVYVGDETEFKNLDLKAQFDYFIDLPIYSSKILSIINDDPKNRNQNSSSNQIRQKFNATVLVAEDNINNQKLMKILLENLGIRTEIVDNGRDAIDLYKKSKFDLILMDINMPELDGVSATKEIRKLQIALNLHKTPIIALTANSISGDKERYIEAGMDDYISKPIEIDKFIEVLQRYLSKETTPKIEDKVIEKKYEPYKKSDAINQLSLSESTVDMLLDNFFISIGEDLDKLQNAIDKRDLSEIKNAAHYIKSGCLNLAMKEAGKLLNEIELDALNGKIVTDITEIKTLFYKIKDELKSL